MHKDHEIKVRMTEAEYRQFLELKKLLGHSGSRSNAPALMQCASMGMRVLKSRLKDMQPLSTKLEH